MSPDGKRIAFAGDRDDDGITELYVMKRDGSKVRRVTRNSVGDEYPAWSPDGKLIAFVSDDADGRRCAIRLVGLDGSGERTLTPEGSCDVTPHWQPR